MKRKHIAADGRLEPVRTISEVRAEYLRRNPSERISRMGVHKALMRAERKLAAALAGH